LATEDLFISIIIILVSARLLGEIGQRFHQPALVGEILAGIILGPSLLSIVIPDEDLVVLSELAVFFLMFLAGLEMHPEEIRKAGKSAIIISSLAFSLPLLGGVGISLLFSLDTIEAMFMGLLLSITAVPVSAIVLMEFGIIRTRLGNAVITAAVINDIFSLVILSVILQLDNIDTPGQIDYTAIGLSAINIGSFIAGIFIIDLLFRKTSHWLPKRIAPLFSKMKTKEAAFGILLITTITISLIAQEVGLHFVIGTFFSGLIVYKQIIGKKNFDRVYGIVSAISFGFFAPIFFALIGIEFNAQSLLNDIPLFLSLFAVAVIGKIGGGYLGARLTKFNKEQSLSIGFLMNGRGMVELVIASIGFSAGILDLTLFSIAVAIGVITTIMAPVLARSFIEKSKIKTKHPFLEEADNLKKTS
jgi:Kef-type K+ transport system membrane component KefB